MSCHLLGSALQQMTSLSRDRATYYQQSVRVNSACLLFSKTFDKKIIMFEDSCVDVIKHALEMLPNSRRVQKIVNRFQFQFQFLLLSGSSAQTCHSRKAIALYCVLTKELKYLLHHFHRLCDREIYELKSMLKSRYKRRSKRAHCWRAKPPRNTPNKLQSE